MPDFLPVEVHPLASRARVTVDEPELDGTWLVQIPGTTADPTIFPPDRTLPQLGFDFRDLRFDGEDPEDPFGAFHALVEEGLRAAFKNRRPRRLCIVGHSFGGMLGLDWLVSRDLAAVQALVPSVERVTLVMACAAHVTPMERYQILSDAPLVGPMATWLSHYFTRFSTTSKEQMARIKGLIGQEPPRSLWRDVWMSDDELGFCWRLPKASSLDHFWSVVRCAREYDVEAKVRAGRKLWFDLLILSAEHDAQWPSDLFDRFWAMVEQSDCPRARWCRFPGDDHMSVARQPTKYYKEIKDFLLLTRKDTP